MKNVRSLTPRQIAAPGDARMPATDVTISELLEVPHRVTELPAPAILPMLCQLSLLQNLLTSRLLDSAVQNNHQPAPQEQEHLLSPDQAAKLLGVTVKWLYRHANHLPFTRRLSRKALRFHEQGLRRWIATKRP